MEKQKHLKPSIFGIALATLVLLSIPFVAMQFTNQVDWSAGDFIVAGALLFGTGLSYVLITRLATNMVYRAAVALALGTTLFMIWANLAVGLIGAGPHTGNLMYIGAVAVVILGTIFSRFNAAGMERAMYATVASLVLIVVIALSANMDEYPGSSVIEILGVNGFFAILFAVSGALFHYADANRKDARDAKDSRE